MRTKYLVAGLMAFVTITLSGVSPAGSAQVLHNDAASRTAEKTSTPVLLDEAVPVYPLELASEALAIWRQFTARRPTLLLLSNDPMLVRVPEQVTDQVSKQAAAASREELLRFADYNRPVPLFLPEMTLDVALRQGWFSRLAWAFPSPDASQELSLEMIADRLEMDNLADLGEIASLKSTGLAVTGMLRGVPMTMAALPNLGALTGPVIVHIDQSYFQGVYKNEIATPLLQVVIETLTALRERKIPTLAVTFVNGNLDSRISLNVRFLQEIITRLVASPHMLDQALPINWQRQAQILYLANFFKSEETTELTLAMNAEDPTSAWVKFALYLSAVDRKQGSEALSFLAEAVKLDKVYALEYLTLSDMAYEKGRPDEALRMLNLAAQVYPDNEQIKLSMARVAAGMGDTKTALHLVQQLKALDWSQLYYADMPEYLDGFIAYLKSPEATSQPAATGTPADDPRRQRILK